MRELFLSVFNMSLTASYVILIVILIRLPLKKAPKFISYALWAVVAFRLIIPFSIESVISLMPRTSDTFPISSDMILQETPQMDGGVEVVDSFVSQSIPAPTIGDSVDPLQIYLEIGTYVWILGIMVLLLYSLISVIRLKSQLKSAELIEKNILEAKNLKTPFVFGVIRPKIYLPVGLTGEEKSYILLHEKTHIHRKDHIVKIIAFLILSIHWFNPLVWAAFLLMSADMELSCDEKVLKEIKIDIKKAYANSLLSLATGRHILNSSPLAFGEGNIKGRIKNVLNYRKSSFWVIAVSIIAVIGLGIALVTNPKDRDRNEPEATVVESPSVTTEAAATETTATETTATEIPPVAMEVNVAENLTDAQEVTAVDETTVTTKVEYVTEYTKVSIEFYPDRKGYKFETRDSKTVAYIDSILATSLTPGKEEDLDKNYTNQYTIKLSNDIGGYSCRLYYNTLYEKAYFVKDGGLYQLGTDFARYIDSFLEYTDITVNIEDTDSVELFQTYGWTLDYQINKKNSKLNNIKVLSGFHPNTYYFAYHNELSKDIGLDMSGYSGTSDIDVYIYKIRESMPSEFYPIQDGRGIVVKNRGKIIGAYISAGRHNTFNACSLKGNSFEKVTGLSLNEWFAQMIKADSIDEKLSKLEAKQVVEEYFKLLDKKDAKVVSYCISKSSLLKSLSTNMDNKELYNEGIGLPLAVPGTSLQNLKAAKLLDAELINEPDKNTKVFRVKVELRYKKESSNTSGEAYWDCYMVYESPQTGWKIDEFGH